MSNNGERNITIWSEGYIVNGQSVRGPIEVATVKAKNFDEAVRKHYGDDELLDRRDGYWYHWGCKLSEDRTEVCWP